MINDNVKIKIGICGYGNLGKGVETVISKSADMELVSIFTRRNPNSLKVMSNVPVIGINEIENWKDKIDVMIMCGGSATDLPNQVPQIAQFFSTVDSFDTHARIPEHFSNVDKVATSAKNTSIISVGWDPGLFSLNRAYSNAIFPDGKIYTFWGKGVSQGHSDAIRRIPGVKNAVQYTIPVKSAIERVRAGENPNLSTSEKHTRLCYVVAEEGADKNEIEQKIKNMPNYFDEYETTVNFISEEELKKNHNSLPHGGSVITCGETGNGNKEIIEYSLTLDSNPEFTASIMVASARAAYRLNKSGQYGAKTIFDLSASLLSPKTAEELRSELL